MLSPAAAAPRSAGPGGPGEARPGAPLPHTGEARTCWVIVINYQLFRHKMLLKLLHDGTCAVKISWPDEN